MTAREVNRGRLRPAHLLTLVLTSLLLIAPMPVSPAHAASQIRVDDQTITMAGDRAVTGTLQAAVAPHLGYVRWSATGAPEWLTVNGNGTLAGGTPAAGGTFTFTITGTALGEGRNELGEEDSATATVIVTPLAAQIDQDVVEAITGVGFGEELSVNGTFKEATFTSPDLPAGLTLSPKGWLTGVLNRIGTYPITVTANYRGLLVTRTIRVEATSFLTSGMSHPRYVVRGRSFTRTVFGRYHVGKVTIRFAGKRPAGLKLKRTSPDSYKLTGFARKRKIPVTLTAHDESGASDTYTHTLIAKPASWFRG